MIAALRLLPNGLTLLRLLLAVFILWSVLQGHTARAWWAILAAGLSDLLDGLLARALKAESAFGQRLDPIADKAVVTAALLPIASAYFGQVAMPGVLIFAAAAIIMVRDWGVELLRLALARKGRTLPPSRLAKVKTAVEYAALLTIYGSSAFGAANAAIGPDLLRYGVFILLGAAALAVITGAGYAFSAARPPRETGSTRKA